MRVLIIGQGIAGTWLSYYLLKAGTEVVMIDEAKPNSATRVASGVINPVTGRQVVTTWMADSLLPLAEAAYTEIGNLLHTPIIQNCGIYAFPPSEQMQQAYQKKIEEASPYVHPLPNGTTFEDWFQFFYGVVHIQPAYWIDLQALLAQYRQWLKNQNLLIEKAFDASLLQVSATCIQYGDIAADYIFYCQGIAIAESDYWKGLPFSFNKGEALIVEIPGLPHGHIYKFGFSTLVPWRQGLWWVGSTYDNRFADDRPTEAFFEKTTYFLRQTLKVPFTIHNHLAAIRPTTLERRPFAGLHPLHQRVGILGGLGTKGVSLAPWLAKQTTDYLMEKQPLHPEVDVARYRRAFL
jgi:glycine/D-amino acid oxidase-like deaminating enzyme